jgi:hypothetical protein
MKRTLTCIHSLFFSPLVLHRQRRTQKCAATEIHTMAMNATIASLALPHDLLTKITGKPNCAAVMELRKELFENAMSVRSAQGGQCGHLGMTVPAAQHNAMPGAQLWVDPPNPGALQLPANAAQRQIAMIADAQTALPRNATRGSRSPPN